MSKNNKIGEMKLFKEAIKNNVKLNTKLYSVTHLLEVKGVPSHFDLSLLIETKIMHLKWGSRTGRVVDYFWSRDSETLEKNGSDPIKFKAGECGPMLTPKYTGKNFYSTSRVPISNFVVLCDPDSTHMYVPTDWYMLTVYDEITPQMLYEMDEEQLYLVSLNKNLSDETRSVLGILINK
jgi:hypothetical protein